MALRFRQAAQWDDWRGHHYRAAIESGHEPLGVIEGQGSRSSGMTYIARLDSLGEVLGPFWTLAACKSAVRQRLAVRP